MELYPLAILTILTMALLIMLLVAMVHSHRKSTMDLQGIKMEIQLMYLQKLTAEAEILVKYVQRSEASVSLHKNMEKFCMELLHYKKHWLNSPTRIPAIHNALEKAEKLSQISPHMKKSLLVGAMVEESLKEFRKSSVYANLQDHCQSYPALYRNGLVAGLTDLLKEQYPELYPKVTIAGNDEHRRYTPYLEMMLFDSCIMMIMMAAKESELKEIALFLDSMDGKLEMTLQTRCNSEVTTCHLSEALQPEAKNTIKSQLQLIHGKVLSNSVNRKGSTVQVAIPVSNQPIPYFNV